MKMIPRLFTAMVVCTAMGLGIWPSTADAQMRKSDRCEVYGACGWQFPSTSDGVLQILRDAHEGKRKYEHYKNGGNTIHNGDVYNDVDNNGGQKYSSATTIGNWNQNFGDGKIIADQKVDKSILGAKANDWAGDCTDGCEQTSDDLSVQKGGGHQGNSPH